MLPACLSDEAPELGRQQFLGEKGVLEGWWDSRRQKVCAFSPCGASVGECTGSIRLFGAVPAGRSHPGDAAVRLCAHPEHAACATPEQASAWALVLGKCVVRDEPAGVTPRPRAGAYPFLPRSPAEQGHGPCPLPAFVLTQAVGSCRGIDRWCILNIKTLKLFF